MRLVLYTNVLSPHQLPLARELAKKLGTDNFRYVYTEKEDRDHASLRFEVKVGGEGEQWCVKTLCSDEGEARDWLEDADVLLSGLRDFDLFERRAKKGMKNLYMSERWFKPLGLFDLRLFDCLIWLGVWRFVVDCSGYVRLLHLRYFGYARRLVKMTKAEALMLLPIGVHARRDFARIGVPESEMETWGYFVAPSSLKPQTSNIKPSDPLKIMWAGRRIPLKHVEDIERAVRQVKKLGEGEQRISLDLYSSLTLSEVREEMRRHDVFVFASNGYEGWGAVVSEALEEGMVVIGTYEAGSTATILPKEQLYHCGDWRALAKLLEQCCDANRRTKMCHEISEWSAEKAAERLIKMFESLRV